MRNPRIPGKGFLGPNTNLQGLPPNVISNIRQSLIPKWKIKMRPTKIEANVK